MKNSLLLYSVLIAVCTVSCKDKTAELPAEKAKIQVIKSLPFKTISLTDLEAFKEVSANWKVAWKAYIDRTDPRKLLTDPGTGILVNLPDNENHGNLFSEFEHGDIELELDVMLPKGSNSGLYFQGRYELQLFDSWGVAESGHGDMGGIYQRWDPGRGQGNEGYEGVAPRTNAAKAPGLWQHIKVIFHAPRFDELGNKVQNANFKRVWLNGALIHENVEVHGPTRGAALQGENSLGPLMIQGDHGSVAFKDMRYKLYSQDIVFLADMSVTAYNNKQVKLPSLDSLTPLGKLRTDSLSAELVGEGRPQTILNFEGYMGIPKTGKYIFDFKVNGGGGVLLIKNDTVVNLDGDYRLDSLGYGNVHLERGMVPFTLIYNKHRPWTKGFSLEVEGPEVEKHALHAPGSLDLSRGGPEEAIMVEPEDANVVQRSFMMHKGYKRTHCLAVGTQKGIHYAYDLANGSLLKVWNGSFLDVTQMWHGRGEKQLGVPGGFTVSFHGAPQLALLKDSDAPWPDKIQEENGFRLLGYELNASGLPTISYEQSAAVIEDQLIPSDQQRNFKREVRIKGDKAMWFKLADGEGIEKLPDGSFMINNEGYFIDFPAASGPLPLIRSIEGKEELVVEVPAGEHELTYNIIW